MSRATSINTSVINKGLFAVAVVAITGVVGAVNFASADVNNNKSGYGTSGQAVAAAAQAFHDAQRGNGRTFAQIVHQIQNTYHAQRANSQAGSKFEQSFTNATAIYDATTNDALSVFTNQVTALSTSGATKDHFIDQYNHAKADYLNKLDAAKNTFADTVSGEGDAANQAKDAFVGSFNSARDNYSNQMEQAKNNFADTLSNN